MCRFKNKYEQCHAAWHWPNGKRFKPFYCKEGFNYDSKTDEKISCEQCPDWFDRCEWLPIRVRRVPDLN